MSYQGSPGPQYQQWRPEPRGGSGPYQDPSSHQWSDEQTRQMPSPPVTAPQRPAWGQPEPQSQPHPGYPRYGQPPGYHQPDHQQPPGYQAAPYQPYPPGYEDRGGDSRDHRSRPPAAQTSGSPVPTSPAGPYRPDGYQTESAFPGPTLVEEAPEPDSMPESAAPGGSARKAKAARKSLKALAGGKLTAVVAGAVVVLLVLTAGGVWYLTRDSKPQSRASAAAPAPEPSPAVDVKATGGMRVAPSPDAAKLFPSVLKPSDRSEHTREAVGETTCASVAAGKTAKAALKKVGCKKVYLALYVDADKKFAVTMGYIDLGSKAKAKRAAAKDYGTYPKYNTWFKFLIPEGSKITEKTRIFTYVSSDRTYLTFGVTGYYNGRNASKGLDETLTREAIAVGVAVMFA